MSTEWIDRLVIVCCVLACVVFLVGCPSSTQSPPPSGAQHTLPHITTVSYYYYKPDQANIHPPVVIGN